MRMQSIVNSFKTALVALPLLASCGGSVGTAQVLVDPNGLMLPDCQDGQLIGVNPDKSLTCVSALSGMLAPPTCLPGTQALTSMKDAATGKIVLSCVTKGSGANDVTTSTRITKAQTDVNNLQTMVNQITSGGGTRSRYVGASTATSDGDVKTGTLEGIRAAAQLCTTDFGAGAHVCTPFEIYESVIVGDVLDGNTNVGPLMVYMEAWVPPFAAGGTEPTAGLSENCGGHTYRTGDRKWHNTFFTFAAPPGGGSTTRVPRFDAGQSCASIVKLACCK